jgi:ATP phosphoribosyltransferase regulatory subunit
LMELVNQSSPFPIPITLDLSLLKTFDYYTGIVFEAISFSEDRSYLLGQGGRYDQLLKLYDPQGKTSPGIGFSLNIEDLHASLLSTKQLPQQPPASNLLVIPRSTEARVAAVQYADSLRQSQSNLRVELDLGDRSSDAVREYALNCRIQNLAWIAADGTVTEEII